MDQQLREQLERIAEMLRGPRGKALWDVLTAMRGPDTPSERGDMPSVDFEKAYAARRARKFKTVEVLRGAALPGATPGARNRQADHVTLPARGKWEHFDGHVYKAAVALGIRVEYE